MEMNWTTKERVGSVPGKGEILGWEKVGFLCENQDNLWFSSQLYAYRWFFFWLLLLSYRVTPCYFSSLPFYYVSNNV